ncbi:MAG: hypothetical protein HY308_09420 [Gammaproteobacteria bacterium]|nr:hypothetical protein [Gammaproteobacteria bacterium]
MTDDDIQSAITNQTLFLIAGLNGNPRHAALRCRLHQLAGMLELALLQDAKPTFIDFLQHERDYVRDRMNDV